MMRWRDSGGPGTFRWWSGRSARNQEPADRPVRHICTIECRCAITRCYGNCEIGCNGGQRDGRPGTQRSAPMAEHAGDDKLALLAAAARLASGDAGVGDLLSYLQAYYRHVPVEDLAAAGPERIAAVATEQAVFAAHRPQGRALVRIRADGAASLEQAGAVLDIVTD